MLILELWKPPELSDGGTHLMLPGNVIERLQKKSTAEIETIPQE